MGKKERMEHIFWGDGGRVSGVGQGHWMPMEAEDEPEWVAPLGSGPWPSAVLDWGQIASLRRLET
jgi:hypothetical protein